MLPAGARAMALRRLAISLHYKASPVKLQILTGGFIYFNFSEKISKKLKFIKVTSCLICLTYFGLVQIST